MKETKEPVRSQVDKDKDFLDTLGHKATELSATTGCKVHPLFFRDPETKEEIVGYFKEPNRDQKLFVMDKGITGAMSAVSEILPVVLIKEHSDRRIWEEKPENDTYFLGACVAVYDIVKLSINQFKKK